MEGIIETTTRLAAGSTGRTEADIQSDVRKFLLDTPLDLYQGELVDIALEAQAGGGRRIDVEAGCAAIEVKKSLKSPSVLANAARWLRQTAHRGTRTTICRDSDRRAELGAVPRPAYASVHTASRWSRLRA